jgi:hypothetical protein
MTPADDQGIRPLAMREKGKENVQAPMEPAWIRRHHHALASGAFPDVSCRSLDCRRRLRRGIRARMRGRIHDQRDPCAAHGYCGHGGCAGHGGRTGRGGRAGHGSSGPRRAELSHVPG